MAQRRSELQELLELTLGSNQVYFQPPSNITMKYPAIIYERDYRWAVYAGNLAYADKMRYLVTVIDRNPDSLVPEKLFRLPLCQFSRHFVVDGLNHDAYTLYF